MKYLKSILLWLAIATGALGGLAACGGSGSDDDVSGVLGAAYTGPMAGDPGGQNVLNMLLLESYETWGLYATDTGSGVLSVGGFFQGNGALGAGSTFSVANSVSYAGSATGVSSPLFSTYNSTTITGTITAAVSTRTFAISQIPASVYNYNTAASLPSVSGTFGNLQDLTGKAASITVVGGVFSGTITTSGCTFSGTIFPRPSGVNVFNVTVNYDNGVGCDFPVATFGTFTGVAISLTLSGPTQELLLTAVSADRSRGVALIGRR